MSESSKTEANSSQVTSGIAFVALLLGLFAVQNTIFQPTRPPMESTDRTFSEDVRSRLWQDPFQAVEEHRKKYSAQAREAPASLPMPTEILYIDEKKQTKKIIPKASPVQQNGKNKLIQSPDPHARYAYEFNGQEPRLVCYQEEVNKREGSYPDSKLIANSIDELRCQVKNSSEKKLHVLAVMVPGGPYAEDKEWRLRSRYAVVSALTEMDYAPRDAEHIDYVDFEKICKSTLRELGTIEKNGKSGDLNKNGDQQIGSGDLQEKTRFCHMGTFMPYEWFEKEPKNENKDHESVLLLWLNSSEFASIDSPTPLKSLGFLKKQILSSIENQNFQFSVLGPFGSGALKTMFQEMQNLDLGMDKDGSYYDGLNQSLIYTPTATVHLSSLDEETFSFKATDQQWIRHLDMLNRLDLKNKIIRTASTQDKLVDLLLCELALRGITPYRVNDMSSKILSGKCSQLNSNELPKEHQNKFRLIDSQLPHHIVLIGEKDTYYSRRLTETFWDAISELNGQDRETSWIHTFSYLRGLDGITSGAASSEKKEAKNNKESPANHSSNETTREQMERPIGNSQLDYLLGLAEQIKRLDKQYAHEGGIKAIGITGHDTYDKLLILQALRHKFPGALFFTTDLDARFFHPSEIKWTRNLLVASPFGLQLNSKFQKQTPPFRDNFQTSFFLTTKLALCNSMLELKPEYCTENPKSIVEKWTNEPRLFEIGNYEAVNISHQCNTLLDSDEFIDRAEESSKQENGKNRCTRLGESEQNNAIDKQKSHDDSDIGWIVLGVFLLWVLVIFFFTPKKHRIPLSLVYWVLILFIVASYYGLKSYSGLELVSFTNGTSMWPSVLMKLTAVILSGYFFYRIYNKLSVNHEDTEKNYLIPKTNKNNSINERDNIPNYSGTERISIDLWRKDLLNEEIKDQQSIQFSTLWEEYRRWGKLKLTWKRVGIALLVASTLSVAILLTSFNDVTFHHIRGHNNYEFNLLCLGLAAVSYVLLILYIAERVHLSSHFIKLLVSPKVELDLETVKQTYRNKYGLPEGIVRYRILLDFINEHTSAPNKFIYYPFFCLFLIVMSRNYYFDNWPTTPFVLVVYAFFAFLTLISAIRLRAAALYARDQILERLENNSAGAPVNAIWHQDRNNALKLQSFINGIRDFKEGIYRPLAYHPMILNLLVPFSSVGGIYLIEYLV